MSFESSYSTWSMGCILDVVLLGGRDTKFNSFMILYMWVSWRVVHNKHNFSAFSFKPAVQFSYPPPKKNAIHPAVFLCSISAWNILHSRETPGFGRLSNHKHRKFFPYCICSSHSCQPNFTVLPSHTFLRLKWSDFARRA